MIILTEVIFKEKSQIQLFYGSLVFKLKLSAGSGHKLFPFMILQREIIVEEKSQIQLFFLS